MTPYELSVCAELFADKLKGDQENDLFLAYINAYWQRVETLKSFDEMMGKEKQQQKMNDDQMLAKVMELNNMFGGTTG